MTLPKDDALQQTTPEIEAAIADIAAGCPMSADKIAGARAALRHVSSWLDAKAATETSGNRAAALIAASDYFERVRSGVTKHG